MNEGAQLGKSGVFWDVLSATVTNNELKRPGVDILPTSVSWVE